MFYVSELQNGPVIFQRNISLTHSSFPDKLIPGSTRYEAREPFLHMAYQELEQSEFSCWKTWYAPTEDVILRTQCSKPWLGFRIALKKHIRHIMHGQEVFLMQGQFHLSSSFRPESLIALQKGQIYEAFDMSFPLEWVERLPGPGPVMNDFLEQLTNRMSQPLVKPATWATVSVLDAVEYLMQHPEQQGVAEEVLRRVAAATTQPNDHRRPISEQQLESLYQVRDHIKANYLLHLSLEELAQKAYMNLTYFKEMFFQVFALTPYQYLIYERIKIAKQLMRKDPAMPFVDVARLAGFASYNSFRRIFTARENKTLSSWLQSKDWWGFVLVAEITRQLLVS